MNFIKLFYYSLLFLFSKLANELASLEEFRLNREALWIHYHNLESTLDQIKNEHKLAMENLSERDLAYRGRLKKVTKLKINEVISLLISNC